MPRGEGLPERTRDRSGEQRDEHGKGGMEGNAPAEGAVEQTMTLRVPPPGAGGAAADPEASGQSLPPGQPAPPAPSGSTASASGDHSPPLGPAGRIIGGTVSALVLVAAGAFVLATGEPGERTTAPPPAPPAASQQPKQPADVGCDGPDCTGRDPEAMGCGGPHARTVAEAAMGDARVEVRYSQACGAAWARVTGAAPGDALRITVAEASQHGEVGEPGEAYTPMIAAAEPDAPTACVTTPAGAERCTAAPG